MPLINLIRELLKGREKEPTVGDVGYIKERRDSDIPGPCFLCVDAPIDDLIAHGGCAACGYQGKEA